MFILTDLSSKILTSSELRNFKRGKYTKQLDLSYIEDGMYFLLMVSDDIEVARIKLLKTSR